MAYNVLIVDDSAIVRAVVAKTLRIAGVDVGEVYQASNGEEAIAKLESTWIDLVLADINMPVMDGLELVKRMSEKGMLKSIPVAIISTDRSVTRMAELKAQGVGAYLNKPFTPESVKAVVDELLGGKMNKGVST
jgi:two-component system chemotaxis response regulator CheY